MIKFGASGNSQAFFDAGNTETAQSAVWIKNYGLDCFEYSFGRGVNMGDAKAESLGRIFADNGIEISVHAPYYINFANTDNESAEKSFGYVLQSARTGRLLGAKRIVFHPASQGKLAREEAVKLTEERLKRLCESVYENGLSDMYFCPETMGKSAQIGTVEEITLFCKIDKIYIPTVDFGHVNARENGSLKTEKDYYDRLAYMTAELDEEKMKHFHVHFSKIQYTAKGEVRHLTFADKEYGPEFPPLAEALKKLKSEPYIICESAGTQDADAKEMKDIYFGRSL